MRMRPIARLSKPRLPLAAAALGIALTLPALGGGLLGDDYMHRSILLGVGPVASGAHPVFDLFGFVPQGRAGCGDAARRTRRATARSRARR
jgi:hypothetical protein